MIAEAIAAVLASAGELRARDIHAGVETVLANRFPAAQSITA
jgi:hypothetical protein